MKRSTSGSHRRATTALLVVLTALATTLATSLASRAVATQVTTDAQGATPVALSITGALSNDQDDDGAADVGDTVTWSFRVANRGDAVLDDLAVDDLGVSDRGAGDLTAACAPGALSPRAVRVCTQRHVVAATDVDARRLTVRAVAVARVRGGAEVRSATSTATLAVVVPLVGVAAPAVDLTVRADVHDRDGDGLADVGENVTVVFTVINIGDVVLDAGVRLYGEDVSDGEFHPRLEPGQSADLSVDRPTNITWAPGPADLYTAVGVASDGQQVESAAMSEPVPYDRASDQFDLGVALTGVFTDEDGDGRGDVGETVVVTETYTNLGVLTLRGWSYLSEVPQEEPVPPFAERRCVGTRNLPAGERYVCRLVHTITAAEASRGAVGYRVVVGKEIDGVDAYAARDDIVVSFAAGVTQLDTAATAALTDDGTAAGDPNGTADVGEHVRLQVEVTNSGTTTVRDPVVVDRTRTDRGVGWECPSGPIDPGATVTCRSAPVELTDADIANASRSGLLSFDLSVRASGVDGRPVTSVPRLHRLAISAQHPSLRLGGGGRWSDADHDGAFDVGEGVRFQFVVTNVGTVPFGSVRVRDERGLGIRCPVGRLAPGRSTTCTAATRYRLTAADVAAGRVTDRATPTGLDLAGDATVGRAATVAVSRFPRPAVALGVGAVLTDRPGGNRHAGVADLGEQVEHRYRVANTGTVALHGVEVRSLVVAGVAAPVDAVRCPDGSLAPGAVMVCRSTRPHLVTQAEVDRGVLSADADVTALAVDDEAVGVRSYRDLRTSTGPQRLALAISGELSGGDAVVNAGETVRWTYRVTNRGPRTVSAVGVAGGVDCPATSLAPGESLRCRSATEHVVTAKEARRAVVRTSVRATAHRAGDDALVRSPYAAGVVG